MKFTLSGILLRYTNFERTFSCEAATLAEALDQLVHAYPALKDVLLDRKGALNRAHLVSINGEMVVGDPRERRLEPTDQVQLVTQIAGG